MEETLTLEFDGGSRGNPGPAGIGAVVRAEDGTVIDQIGQPIGKATNNVAEYRALILAMQRAKRLGGKRVVIRGDSELIVKQMNGEYRVKNEGLRDLFEEAQMLFREFEDARIEHNKRHRNALADKLANLAMDRKAEVSDADESPIDAPSSVATKTGDKFTCARCGCIIEVKKPSSIRPHQLKGFVCQCGSRMNG